MWSAQSKPYYGIHETPHPETIGRADSHGCVRLTNWDARRLAQMVLSKTELLFESQYADVVFSLALSGCMTMSQPIGVDRH